jgi:CheY-like chemotaxis protein
MTSYHVLLVEDDLGVAGDITRFLQSNGHKVTHIIAVRQLRPRVLGGVAPGATGAVEFDHSQIDVCLMDGLLKETSMSREQKGWELIGYLSYNGDFPFVGISSDDTFNAHMVEAGAVTAVLKNELNKKLLPAIEQAVATKPRQ